MTLGPPPKQRRFSATPAARRSTNRCGGRFNESLRFGSFAFVNRIFRTGWCKADRILRRRRGARRSIEVHKPLQDWSSRVSPYSESLLEGNEQPNPCNNRCPVPPESCDQRLP